MLAQVIAAIAFQSTGSAPPPVWGVTLDDLSRVDLIVTALAGLKKRPTARIVFDPSAQPTYYQWALQQVGTVANLMGEPIDSSPPSGQLTVDQYVARMTSYMTQLQSQVSIWEIGNEVNGDWTCASPEMAQKVTQTLSVAQSMHLTTALTLFYSPDYIGTDRDMVTWSNTYLSPNVRSGINYVLVSYYPTSLTGFPSWSSIFTQLSNAFPNAYLGFGELGLANPDGTLNTNPAQNRQLIRTMYRMTSPLTAKFIRGYFWWTFAEDSIPMGSGLWSTFNQVVH